MLQEELWVLRLAELTGLQATTVELLLQGLNTQLEQRLLAGQVLDFGELGYWRLDAEQEWIAALEDGTHWLIPPLLQLQIVQQIEGVSRVPLLSIAPALAEGTKLRIDLVEAWLGQLDRELIHFLAKHQELHWPSLGTFSISTTGYQLELNPNFAEALNKPFAMFSPVKLNPDTSIAELEVRKQENISAYKLQQRQIVYNNSQPDVQGLPTATELALEQRSVEPSTPLVSTVTAETSDVSSEEVSDVEKQALAPCDVASDTEAIAKHTELSISVPEESEVQLATTSLPKSQHRYRILVYGLMLGIALSLAGYYIFITLRPQALQSEVRTLSQRSASIELPTQRVDRDSLIVPEDTLAQVQEQLPKIETPRLRGDSSEVHTLRAGDRLTRLAYRKYGNKVFWVYIYQENSHKIANPDQLPLGQRIVLPAASKYQINALDTNSVHQALLLQRNLWNRK